MAQPIVERASRTLALDDAPSDLMPQPAPGQPGDRPEDAIQDIIIRSKVRAPVLRDSTLSRARLLEWMDQHADERVRMLVAEAGFGKTTLLADWARRTIQPVRWLKLDSSDAEWGSFISYLIAAFQEGSPDFGGATLRLLGHVATLGVTREQATGQLLAELGAIISEPTVLIIDDVQHVAGNEDVQRIIGRLLERAPQHLRFILSGRGTPELKLGRLTAQGAVVTLGTDDLRFTRQELGDLFSVGYRMPLEADLLGVVDERTEGWAASLQLLHSSLRGQRKAEIREFITVMGGTQRPLYDFLAEEVLGHQEPFMQQVLLHAAVADRVIVSWVTAAMSVTPEPPSHETVESTLAAADELGLMSRNAKNASSRRFHPLLQEFLREHLRKTVTPETMRQIHLAIAKAAEEGHWPTSAHHFIEAGEGAEAMRVIGESSIVALGTGAWGAALALIERIPSIDPSPTVIALQARSLTHHGRADEAVALLRAIDFGRIARGHDRAVVRLALANALGSTKEHALVPEVLSAVLADKDVPELLSLIATAWHGMHTSTDSTEVRASMLRVIAEADRMDLPFYMALSRHNLSLILLADGDPVHARELGRQAVDIFARADHDEGLSASSMLSIAHADYELGRMAEALQAATVAVNRPGIQPDVIAEAAQLLTWLGHSSQAAVLLAHGAHAIQSRSQPLLASEAILASDAWLYLSRGQWKEAWEAASSSGILRFDPNQTGLVAVVRAAAAVRALDAPEAAKVIEATRVEILESRAARWMPYVEVLLALHRRNARGFADLVSASVDSRPGVLLALADVVAFGINDLHDVEPSLETHVRQYASRWRPSLRRALAEATASNGKATATLLAAVGAAEDVAVLRAWEKRKKKAARNHGLSTQLARRISPTLMIHDLGRASMVLANRHVMISDVRRRAATLLLYLVSRPRHVATRDQVFEALWPDQGSTQAANSFHQTLYFLRHDLVMDGDVERPLVEYVPVEADLVYLAPELVHVDSAAFCRRAAEVASRSPRSAEALSLVQSYEGKFAPEFEYEDWAIAWREHVHATFLDLVEQAARARLPDRAPEATAILRQALGVDPEAIELKPLLAAAMHLSGSQAAAQHLYRQYAIEHDREFGEPAPPLAEVLAAVSRSTRQP